MMIKLMTIERGPNNEGWQELATMDIELPPWKPYTIDYKGKRYTLASEPNWDIENNTIVLYVR